MLGLALATAGIAYLTGVLDGLLPQASSPAAIQQQGDAAGAGGTAEIPAQAGEPEGELEASGIAPSDTSPAQRPVARTPAAVPVPVLPAGDEAIRLSAERPQRLDVILVEGGPDYRIDLLRDQPDSAQTLAVSVSSFSGNRSPLATGNLTLEPARTIEFLPGQSRAQLVLGMRDDPLREADTRLELVIEASDGNVLASIGVRLEDDDQRRFEQNLPVNTVAFAAGQISVGEADNAVQIEVIRYRPDERSLRVGFTVSDVTAVSGEDYFEPAENIIEFAPGQRSARILIPIVKDAEVESNEAFVLELISANAVNNAEIYERVAVMIRDDD